LKFKEEVQNHILVCAFCGSGLSAINTDCNMNNKFLHAQSFYTDELPSNIKSGRHWFGKPSNK